MKTLTLAALISMLMVPVASAQSTAPAAQPTRRHTIQRIVRSDLARIRQGTRAGQITPAERRRLGARLRSLRADLQSLRQGGTRPSAGERAKLRGELRRLNRSIFVARHNRRIK